MSCKLEEIELNIKVEKQEIEYEKETGDNSTTWNVHNDQDSINTSAVIKKEYEFEEDSKSPREHFESIYIKEVKPETENYEDENSVDHMNVDCKTEKDIEEYPLDAVKDEPMSDSETPQDGSKINVTDVTEQDDKIPTGNILKNYILTRDLAEEKTCEICKKKFSSKWNLIVHMRCHTGETPFQCDLCKKKFICKWSLDLHQRKHTGERPYECKVCKKAFARSGTLTIHLRKHTGERPYECKICKHSFTQLGSLTIHMRKHSGERPFQCEICKKKFTKSGDLKRHAQIHSGERPHECEICGLTFCQRFQLNKHYKLYHCSKKT